MSDQFAHRIAFVKELSTNFGERSLNVNIGEIPVASLTFQRMVRPGYRLGGFQRQTFEIQRVERFPIERPGPNCARKVVIRERTVECDWFHYIWN